MNQNTSKYSSLFLWLPYLVFFIGSFIYFGYFADYIFFYQEKSALFVCSSDFLLENIHQPGGLLIYFGKFLSTFFYDPLVGAAIVSAILTLIIVIISKIIRFLSGKEYFIFPLIIGTALFYLQTDYRFLLFNNLGLLLQLTIFLLAIRYSGFLKGWIPVLIMPLWYFITGGFAWIFVFMLTLNLASDKARKGWIKIIGLLCLNLMTFYVFKEFLFFQSGKTLLMFPFTELNTESQQILFIAVACIISMLPVTGLIRFSLSAKYKVSALVGGLIASTLTVILLFGIGIKQFDKKRKQYFHVEKLFYQNKFDELIAYNTANPPSNILTIFLNNIALCEKDQLDDLLFHFRQSSDGKTFFLKWEMESEELKRGGYFYYSIGMVNEAHRWAFENMVMKGQTPEGLKMLIKTELINGNYKMASRYIDILKYTFFYKDEAEAFEKLLFNDKAINADPELGEKRHNRIKVDFFSITDDPYINVEKILAKDSLNKKAFEYKLAFMLLKKDYKGIAKELPKFESFGFTKLPVHIEEVAVALPALKMGKLPDLGKIRINKNTELQWHQYLAVFQQYGSDPRAAEPELRKQFGNTFWYYVFYK